MMYFKLSLRNAKRQARDYLVYFVTVVMVAALIYACNGLVFSEEIKTLSQMMKMLPVMIVLASIVVIGIVGWLVSFMNNFMLVRRSREFGIYILSGLESRQVARLFFLENMAVGGCALALGLVLGNFLFQALRAVILALFGVGYSFSFAFSLRALGLTFLYFMLVYLFAQWRSRRRLRTMKIYDLVYYERLNEGMVIRTSRKRRWVFAGSLVLGTVGTLLLLGGGMLFGVLGAGCVILFLFGFFLSFASGVPAFYDRYPARKYHGSALMVFRTLTAKLATMGVSMATIALLFTATLISEGAGIVIRAIFVGRAADTSCFDLFLGFDAERAGEEGTRINRILEYAEDNIPVESSVKYPVYQGETAEFTEYIESEAEYFRYYDYDALMRRSDYDALREMLRYPAVTSGKGEFLIHCQTYVAGAAQKWDCPIVVGGRELLPGGVYTEPFLQSDWKSNGHGFVLVVPDDAAQDCPVSHIIYAAVTEEPVSEAQYRAVEKTAYDSGVSVLLYAGAQVENEVASSTALMVVPLYYLSLVLTMAAATILTVWQLSETDRYRHQFVLLRKLGMDRREMESVLRRQFSVYYAMPAVPPMLIGLPCIVSMARATEPGVMVGLRHPFAIAGAALAVFLIIYAVYILLAYFGLRRNVLPD